MLHEFIRAAICLLVIEGAVKICTGTWFTIA